MRKWLEKCEKLVGKNQRPNWPKLQAQKPEPVKTETNWNRRFFNYFSQFRLRLLQTENFGFGFDWFQFLGLEFGPIGPLVFSYQFFTFFQPFSQLPNKFYYKKIKNIHLTQPKIKIKTSFIHKLGERRKKGWEMEGKRGSEWMERRWPDRFPYMWLVCAFQGTACDSVWEKRGQINDWWWWLD